MSNETTEYNKQATQQLLKAVVFHNLEDTVSAIRNGADINAIGADGNTPLIRAMAFPSQRSNMLQVIMTLINYGADPNKKNSSGVSPLVYASHLTRFVMEREAIIEALLEAGAKIGDEDISRKSGETVLMLNCDLRPDVVGRLIEQTKDINARNISGQNALMLLLKNSRWFSRSLENVKQLISAGIDVNAKDVFGDTALHYTSRMFPSDKDSIMGVLITAGADINARNDMGCSPLDLVDDSEAYIIRYLAELGAEGGERRLEEIEKKSEESLSYEIPVAERTLSEQLGDMHTELGISLCGGTLSNISVKGKTVSFTFDDDVSPTQFANEVYNYSDVLLRVLLNETMEKDPLLICDNEDERKNEEKALKGQLTKLEKCFNSNFSAKSSKKSKAKPKKSVKKSAKKAKASKAKKSKKK